jgi:predicted amidohydrolase YtcJ
MRFITYGLALTTACLLYSCSTRKEKADLILLNGTIYTVDSAFTVCEAMAVTNGTISATGSNDEIRKAYEASSSIDLKGQAVYPGFIDAHCHFLSYGLGLSKVNLVGTSSWQEVIQRVESSAKKRTPNIENTAQAAPEGAKSWIAGRGWDQNDWDSKDMPDNRALDSLFPDRPVFLTRIDGHAAIANSTALKLAGIKSDAKIAGGEFAKKNGKLTGLLVDNAVDFVKNVMPRPSAEAKEEALLLAQHNCLEAGITTVDEAGLMAEDVALIDRLHKNGKLKMRVYAMLSDSAPNYSAFLEKGPYKTTHLNVRAFKYYADGALGSRGACLLQDYNDKQAWKGFLLAAPEHFTKYARLLAEKGFQMCTHCIGDSAYRLMIDVYRQAGAGKAARWRIEHAQVVNAADFVRSSEIVPSVQPTHATSDMYWAAMRLGPERAKGAYAIKDLLRSAGVVALGTDFPVEDISPFKTFYAAVARQDDKGYPPGGYQVENGLTREETLKGMTVWAAYANFEEKEKGSLEKGKLADFIILDKDIMKCAIPEVLRTNVQATYIGGVKLHGK